MFQCLFPIRLVSVLQIRSTIFGTRLCPSFSAYLFLEVLYFLGIFLRCQAVFIFLCYNIIVFFKLKVSSVYLHFLHLYFGSKYVGKFEVHRYFNLLYCPILFYDNGLLTFTYLFQSNRFFRNK